MEVAKDRTAGAPGGRLGAVVDVAIWLGVLVLEAVVVSRLGGRTPSGAFTRLAAPAEMLVLLIVATMLMRRRGEGWRSVGLAPPASIRRVAGLVVGGYLAAIASNAACVLLAFPALGLSPPSFGALGALQGHPWAFAQWLVVAWVSAAVGEELQFRGFLWSRIERLFGGGRWAVAPTLVVQAGLFGLGHIYQGLGGALVTGGMGLVLGVVFLAGRRNLVGCMVLHGLIDTISLTAMFFGAVPTAAAP
jgi:membrane protease YdiL (CAAX protease family)